MDPGCNAQEIGELQERIKKVKEEAKDAYGQYQASEIGTPKFHMWIISVMTLGGWVDCSSAMPLVLSGPMSVSRTFL